MAYLGIDFSQYVEDDLLPEGAYTMEIVSSEIQKTNSNDPKDYLTVEFKVISGPCRQGRRGWEKFWMWGGNTDVARRSFANLLKACGLNPKTVEDSVEIVGCRVCCYVRKYEKNDRDYNAFSRYKPAPAVEIGATATPAPTAPVQRPVAPSPAQAQAPQAPAQQRLAPSEAISSDEAPF